MPLTDRMRDPADAITCEGKEGDPLYPLLAQRAPVHTKKEQKTNDTDTQAKARHRAGAVTRGAVTRAGGTGRVDASASGLSQGPSSSPHGNRAHSRRDSFGLSYLFGEVKEREVIQALPLMKQEHAPLAQLYATLTRHSGADVGHEISRAERKRTAGFQEKGCVDLGYGEVTFEMMVRLISGIKELHGGLSQGGEVFYDLGSGTGKAVFAAAMCHRFRACRGVELLHGLHKEAKQLQANYATNVRRNLPDERGRATIDLRQGDLGDPKVDWSEADLVLSNSTVFGKGLMRLLEERSRCMKVGSFFVTTTKTLPPCHTGGYWKILSIHKAQMSFAKAHVYVQQKIK
jgi:SAM-dependent methyltransferase